MRLPISVVLCSYNGARFIREQIASILEQTYAMNELIVVDDASTDDTCSIIEGLALSDNRIRLYRNTHNIGFNANFEKALRLASGELIAIADQDDIWHREKLQRMLAQMEDAAELVYCDSVRFSADIPASPKANRRNLRIAGTDPRKLAMYNTVSGHAIILRRSLLEHALPVPAGVYYDWWLAMNAICHSLVQFVPEILVYQRAHDSNVTIQQNLTARQLRNQYRSMLNLHLAAFAGMDIMKEADRAFFQRFYALWHASLTRQWNWALFWFMLQHRQSLFANKVRIFPLISQVKHCFLFAFRA